MDIETTININSNLLNKINKASLSLNISMNKIITMLICKVINSKTFKFQMFTSVKYQTASDDVSWHTLHVSFNGDVYEKALDLRKILKMSVSFIVASAIERYLKDLLRDMIQNKNTDNNSNKYVFIPKNYKGLFFFTIFWNNPTKKIIKRYT